MPSFLYDILLLLTVNLSTFLFWKADLFSTKINVILRIKEQVIFESRHSWISCYSSLAHSLSCGIRHVCCKWERLFHSLSYLILISFPGTPFMATTYCCPASLSFWSAPSSGFPRLVERFHLGLSAHILPAFTLCRLIYIHAPFLCDCCPKQQSPAMQTTISIPRNSIPRNFSTLSPLTQFIVEVTIFFHDAKI